MLLEGKLDLLARRYEEIASLLVEGCSAQEYAKLSKEYSDLQIVVELYENYKQVVEDIAASNEMLKDPELKELAREELEKLKNSRESLEQDLKLALIPKDMTDEKSAILEIRAGTGGDEASLFVADLFKMYHRYADRNNWKVEVMDSNEIGIGGYKEIIVSIVGHKVFGLLKFESGVHRVQRVPATETNGRIHTSAATVAVLPEVENVDVEINTNDLRIDTYRASGAGGQHINTTDSAVRITHIPTGIVAQCQDGRSQIKNREKAMTMLRSRIYDAQLQKQSAERADSRKSQVGSGDRSERIRTYNYPQGRVTDHRINLTLYNLEMIMTGELDEIVNSLHTADQLSKLAEFT